MTIADKLCARFTAYRMAVAETPAERVIRLARQQEAERVARRDRRPEVLCDAVLTDGEPFLPHDFDPRGSAA